MDRGSNHTPATLSEQSHPRTFRENRFVYPVLSRRSGGISVGINLNPDKACNFDCIYCQVDRSVKMPEFFVGIEQLAAELTEVLTGLRSAGILPACCETDKTATGRQDACGTFGALWMEPEFAALPPDKRHVADIAFSGDGEPTTFKNFTEVIARCIDVKEALGFHSQAVVLITNATGLDRPEVKRGLELMDRHHGEVWAKLDAGTAEYFALIDNTPFPFAKVLQNIQECARARSVVIQSCFMKVNGAGPADSEISAFVDRLNTLRNSGGMISRVQVYTIARAPAYSYVSSLSDAEVNAIVERVRTETGLAALPYYGDVSEGRGTIE